MNLGPVNPASQPLHTYLPGQSLVEIALIYSVSLQDLLDANQITTNSILFPGQKLLIPTSIKEPSPVSLPEFHQVGPQETLLGISEKYSINVLRLQKINNLADGAMLFPGMRLKLTAEESVQAEIQPESKIHCLIHGYHKIKPGDQLARVAAFHGVSTQSLLTINDLGWNSVVPVGTKLVVPIGHDAFSCPELVRLPQIALTIAEQLISQAELLGLTDSQIVAALCLEMQRSGLQPELGSRSLIEKLLTDISGNEDLLNVKQTLIDSGYEELADGASRWEPSALVWLHQVRSNSE